VRDCDKPRKEEKEGTEREMVVKKWCYVLATLLSLSSFTQKSTINPMVKM